MKLHAAQPLAISKRLDRRVLPCGQERRAFGQGLHRILMAFHRLEGARDAFEKRIKRALVGQFNRRVAQFHTCGVAPDLRAKRNSEQLMAVTYAEKGPLLFKAGADYVGQPVIYRILNPCITRRSANKNAHDARLIGRAFYILGGGNHHRLDLRIIAQKATKPFADIPQRMRRRICRGPLNRIDNQKFSR